MNKDNQPKKTEQSAKTGKKSGKGRRVGRTIGIVLGTILLVTVLTSAIFVGIFMTYVNTSLKGHVEVDMSEYDQKVSTELYYQDPDTKELVMYQTLFGDENRIWVDFDSIPKNLREATIAIEDKRFESHHGVDWHGTLRAVFRTLTKGNTQGGSTITQQLIKNVTGNNENTVKRKVTEVYRALALEKDYSKDEILEMYLNTIYLGNQCYGVQTASRTYFHKDVSELTLAECACLISITNNPSQYDPLRSDWTREQNRNRQLDVLDAMLAQEKIDQATYDAAKAQEVVFTNGYTNLGNYVGPQEEDEKPAVVSTANNSYFTDALYYELLNDLQEKANYTAEEASSLIFNGGLRVYSTVDPKVQSVIEEELYNADDAIPALWHEAPVALRDYPADTSSWDDVQYDEATGLPVTKDGYAVYGVEDIPVYEDDAETELKKGTSTDPNYPNDDTVYLCVYEKVRTEASAAILDYNGNILGIGGGIGEKQYDLGTNRATIPHQTGSTMKPIGAYCLALDYGLINYSSQILDAPFYSAADKEVLKEQYSYMDKYSAAAQSRSDIWRDWPTNYGGAGGQGNPMLVYDALRQSYNTVATWSAWITCTTSCMIRWNAAISAPKTIWTWHLWCWAARAAA